MYVIDNFVSIYNNLSTIELIILWVVIFTFILLIIISISLSIKNKKLKEIIKLKENEPKEIVKEVIKEVIKEVPKVEEVKEEIKKQEGPYSKNVLKDISARYQTSPINIVNDEIKIDKLDKKENISFTEEVTRKLENEYKPQTIELTDYEKKQEEEAIISYKELLNTNKEKLYNITDEEETTDFIKELKSFRSSL